MNYKIQTTARFEKDVKRLKKNFPNIKSDVVQFVKDLRLNPNLGISLGDNIFKARIPNSSVPVGKRGGFRVVTYYEKDDILYLVTIYSKAQIDNILTNKLKQIVQTEISDF